MQTVQIDLAWGWVLSRREVLSRGSGCCPGEGVGVVQGWWVLSNGGSKVIVIVKLQLAHYFKCSYLPPAKEVSGKVIFSQASVSHSVHRWELYSSMHLSEILHVPVAFRDLYFIIKLLTLLLTVQKSDFNSFVRQVDFCGLFVFIAEWSKWYVAYNLQVGLTVTVPIVV